MQLVCRVRPAPGKPHRSAGARRANLDWAVKRTTGRLLRDLGWALACLLWLGLNPARGMEPVAVAADGRGFVLAESGRPFVPRGFNYDHDRRGRLIEDYWFDEWPTVEEDFREMQALGANAVRIHLQTGKFLPGAHESDPRQLAQLARLVALAESLELYLDLTGLGCYHRADVPGWYDALDETQRWQAQADFWTAVAGTCAKSPAVWCYDLMNEPVVAGARREPGDWLGPPFADKHFVQFITLDPAGRDRPDIARAWIEHLVEAVRRVDRRHLITVGLVDWSLDRPGLTSGFVPSRVSGPLDFVAVHLYPQEGQLEAAQEVLRQFDVGKPLVLEETFPLKCRLEDFERFLDGAAPLSGWLGFYWGQTPAECRAGGSLAEAITAAWLDCFARRAGGKTSRP